MKTGICQICRKEFKLTKNNYLHRHGYKQELRIKIWQGIVTFTKTYYKLVKPPCTGSGLPAITLKEKGEKGDI